MSSSLIVGQLETPALKFHLFNTIVAMAIYLGVLYYFILRFGVIGAGLALIVLTSLRMIGSYVIVYLYRGRRS